MAFVSLIAVNFFNSMGQMMMNTLIPLYAYSLGATAAMVGTVTSAFAVTALLCRPVVGPAFDSFSKKWMLVAAMVVSAVAVFLYGQMTTVAGLIFARLLHGVAMSCTGPLAMALVSSALPEERIGSGLSIYGIVGALCMAVGPALGLWMAGIMSYTFVFTISAGVLGVACVLVVLLKEPEAAKTRKPYRIKLSRIFAKGALIPGVITCTLCIASSCVGSFIAIYAGLRGVENIGLYFTVNAVVMLATRPLYGAIADRRGFSVVIIPGLFMFALAFVVIGNATTLPMYLLGAVLNAFGFGGMFPLVQALAIQCVPLDQRGAASNTYFMGMDLGMLIGPSLGGAIIDLLQEGLGIEEVNAYGDLYFLAIISIAVGGIVYLCSRKRLRALQVEARKKIRPSSGESAKTVASCE